MLENKIVHMEDEVSYYLNLPHLIVGSLTSFQNNVKVLENNKIVNKEILYNQTLTKMIDEAIQNSIDENTRTNGKYANKIDIKIDKIKGVITIKDNGRGIPLDTYVMATTKFRTSSNFNFLDEQKKDRVTIGAHGIGNKILPLFSTWFKLTTVTLDKDRGIIETKDNMKNVSHKEDKAPQSFSNGVIVEFMPDFNRLELNEITDDLINHLHALLINIAFSNPDIIFTFQGRIVKVDSFKDFLKYYTDTTPTILEDDESIKLAVLPSENGYSFVHIVNSLDLNKGGVTLDYISNNIIGKFTERLKKGYSKITTTSVKNKINVVLILKNMKNLRFGGGQTKEELKNTVTELGLKTLNYSKYADELFKNKNLKDPIIELYRIQQEYENRRANTFENKENKEIFNPKHIKASKDPEFLFVAEGDSALASLIQALGRENFGYLPLSGKLMNCSKSTISQCMKNQRVQDIINAFGIGLEQNRYKNLVISTDSDLDGSHITSLLIAFIYKFQPDLLYNKKVYKLRTPIICVLNPKDELVEWYYTLSDFKRNENNIPKNHQIMYMKGLGSWNAKNYKVIFKHDTLDKCLEQIEFDDNDIETINKWMSDEGIEFRKSEMSKKSFMVDKL